MIVDVWLLMVNVEVMGTRDQLVVNKAGHVYIVVLGILSVIYLVVHPPLCL